MSGFELTVHCNLSKPYPYSSLLEVIRNAKRLTLCASSASEEHRDSGKSAGTSSSIRSSAKKEYCGDCDGTGWTEGGRAIQTECSTCNGTGLV